MTTIADAIKNINPDARFVVRENGGDFTVDWIEGTTPISNDDLLAKQAELQAEYDALQYQRDRQYPELGEQLDMLFHDMTVDKGSKTGEWYSA